VVCKNRERDTQQVDMPLCQGPNNSEHFLLMHGVIELCTLKCHGFESHWVRCSPGLAKRENSTCSKVAGIGGDIDVMVVQLREINGS